MMTDIRGKTAVVTGAAKRIGRVISLQLAEQGVNVVFSYRVSADEAAKTEEDVRAKGVSAMALQADLTDLDACDNLIEKATAAFGGVDILVNNASEFPQTKLGDLHQDRHAFSRQFDNLAWLHMRAPMYLGMRLGLQMKRNGWGRIVNITDRVTVKGQGYSNWILYLATKYGLYGLTQALALELSPEVTVNSVAPGLVIPPPELDPQEVERLRAEIPLKKEAGPEEIAADVLHLIKSEAKTGTVIVTDGGSSVQT